MFDRWAVYPLLRFLFIKYLAKGNEITAMTGELNVTREAENNLPPLHHTYTNIVIAFGSLSSLLSLLRPSTFLFVFLIRQHRNMMYIKRYEPAHLQSQKRPTWQETGVLGTGAEEEDLPCQATQLLSPFFKD